MKARTLKRRHDAQTLHERREWRRFRVAFTPSAMADLSFRAWRHLRHWRP